MAKMLNKPDKRLSCGCCTLYMRSPSGRRFEEREWRREWKDEQCSEDVEYEYMRAQAEARERLEVHPFYSMVFRGGNDAGDGEF